MTHRKINKNERKTFLCSIKQVFFLLVCWRFSLFFDCLAFFYVFFFVYNTKHFLVKHKKGFHEEKYVWQLFSEDLVQSCWRFHQLCHIGFLGGATPILREICRGRWGHWGLQYRVGVGWGVQLWVWGGGGPACVLRGLEGRGFGLCGGGV